jgi:maltooligosyltrehalose trehalohydrolase
VKFRVWAPLAKTVDLVLVDGDRQRPVRMAAETGGYFAHVEPSLPAGQRYAFSLDGGPARQDPCSLHQPAGVPGPSAVVLTQGFKWTDQAWRGVPREELVFYELHVGTFTREGTFDAVIPRLRELRELGVTAIEIMPVAQFPGNRNWGYDGVLLYAAQNSYCGPHGLARLVDACHAEGLACFLDVVYNHFGPESNFLHEFGPYFTDKYKTPWGKAVNYDDKGCDPVRDYVLDNARMWLEEFHFDGLRLDAVHAIYDMGAKHILAALADVADEAAVRTGRRTHLVAESDLNDPRVILPHDRGGHGMGAQWSDDFHHAVHALLTGERRGYYQDYGDAKLVARAMENPFLCAGDYSPHRGRRHGAPVPPGVAGDRFVVCVQNHDQVGNRAKGDRLSTLVGDPAKQRLAAALMLLSPHLPLLFMGEEYGEENPFPFFCSFNGEELVQAVREGRKREFADFLTTGEFVPDPDATATFDSAKLSWSWPEGTPRAGLRRLYGDLLAARRAWPPLRDFARRSARVLEDRPSSGGVIELTRGAAPDVVRAYFNLGDRPVELPGDARTAAGAGTVALLRTEDARYTGGVSRDRHDHDLIQPYECVITGPAGWKTFG